MATAEETEVEEKPKKPILKILLLVLLVLLLLVTWPPALPAGMLPATPGRACTAAWPG